MCAFAVPLARIPSSHNTSMVKLVFFSICSGLLLLCAGLDRKAGVGIFTLLAALSVPVTAILGICLSGGMWQERVIAVSSAGALFLAVRISRLRYGQLLPAVVAGGSFAVLMSLIRGADELRLAGYLGNANLMGSFSAGLLPVGTVWLISGKTWRRYLSPLFILTVVYTLYRSGTRASAAALLLSIGTVLILRWKQRLLPLFALGFLAMVSVTVFLPRLPDSRAFQTLQVRSVIWSGAAGMIGERPLAGWGTGSFQRIFPEYRDPEFQSFGVTANTAHAHSEPLETMAENGIPAFLIICLAFYLFMGNSLRRMKDPVHWAVLASVMVLLLESPLSVAMRWTSSVYLFAVLASLLPLEEEHLMRGRPLSAALAVLGFLIAAAGGYGSYRLARSSEELGQALIALFEGGSPAEVREHCMKSLSWNRDELGSWYTLGNVWGIEPGDTDAFSEQVAAYDSLCSRAPDYAWTRLNRIHPLAELGMYHRAMGDVLHVFRTRASVRDAVLSTGYRIAGECDVSDVLALMNLELSIGLRDETATKGRSARRVERLLDNLCVVYSLAGVRCPEAVPSLREETERILTGSPAQVSERVFGSIERELLLCGDGERLYLASSSAPSDSVIQAAEMVFSSGTVTPWHRAAWARAAVSVPGEEDLKGLWNYVVLFEHFFLHYPGYPEILCETADISRASGVNGHEQRVVHSLLVTCMAEEYFYKSFRYTGSADTLWLRTGGPLLEAAGTRSHVSAMGMLVESSPELHPEVKLGEILLWNSYSAAAQADPAACESIMALAVDSISMMMVDARYPGPELTGGGFLHRFSGSHLSEAGLSVEIENAAHSILQMVGE